MPEGINSAGWVLVGWGAACGFAIACLLCMSYHWWYRLRTHVTVAGAAEQRLNRVRDKAAIRALRTSLATACRPVVARTAIEVAAAYGSVRPRVSVVLGNWFRPQRPNSFGPHPTVWQDHLAPPVACGCFSSMRSWPGAGGARTSWSTGAQTSSREQSVPCGPVERAWTLLDQQAPTVAPVNDGYPVDVREAAAASQVRAQTRVFADGDESPKAGRHRFEELSGDTQQIDGDRIQRVLGVAS
jgi:hypothetical protein